METPADLFSAGKDGNLELVKALLQRGHDIDARDVEKGNTALIIAAQNKRETVVEYLIQREANVNIANHEGDTALHLASQNESIRIATLIAQNGGDLYKENNRGWSPLEKASKNLKQVLLDSSERFRIKNQTDPAFCTAVGEGLERGTSGAPATFTIQALNGFKKKIPRGGDPFSVSVVVVTEAGEPLEGLYPTVRDNNDGTYSVSLIPSLPGEYQITISLFGTPISGCPYKCVVKGGLEDLLRTLRLYHDRNRELEEAVSKKEQKVEDISRNRRALDETKIRLEERADRLKRRNVELEEKLKEVTEESSRKDKILSLKDTELEELRKQFGITGGGRTVIRQDWAVKRGTKVQNWKRRYCVLYGDRKLEYFAQKGCVDLMNVIEITKSSQSPHCLCICTKERKPFFVRFDNDELQEAWLDSLRKVQGLGEAHSPNGLEHENADSSNSNSADGNGGTPSTGRRK